MSKTEIQIAKKPLRYNLRVLMFAYTNSGNFFPNISLKEVSCSPKTYAANTKVKVNIM